MATIIPVTFNSGATISGTLQVGDLAIGTSPQDYTLQPGGKIWWSTPDLDLAYAVAHPNYNSNQPNPLSVSGVSVGFWKTETKTQESFITLAESIAARDNDPQTFTGGTEAKEWLTNNGYWSSYFEYIISAGKTDTGGFQVGESIEKDMTISSLLYDSLGTPNGASPNITASYWEDWGEDIFDGWGYFYLYDPAIDNYLGLQFNTINQPDGTFSTQNFTFNGRTFTIVQGYPVQGIFKFEIRVNDDLPFVFGEGGNMGSNGSTINSNLTYSYTLGGTNLTLYYNENYQSNNITERLYSYYIPFDINLNSSKTYTEALNGDDLYLYSVQCTNGLTVYHSKRYDVKEWVVYDLTFGE